MSRLGAVKKRERDQRAGRAAEEALLRLGWVPEVGEFVWYVLWQFQTWHLGRVSHIEGIWAEVVPAQGDSRVWEWPVKRDFTRMDGGIMPRVGDRRHH